MSTGSNTYLVSENRLYLPGLNSIRAIAALSVLFGHMWAPFGD